MNRNYDYFDNLSVPDEDFINEIKKVLKLLYGIDDNNMNGVKNIDSLMIFIQENLMKNVEKGKTITINQQNTTDQQIIYPEIYDELDIEWKNDESIWKLINYCLKKNEENEHKFMLIVSHLLPILVEKSYNNLVDKLMARLTYVKVPPEWIQNRETFISIHEDLWEYSSLIEVIFKTRFEKESRHHVTLCYIPLPGLCIFPDDNNNLFPSGLSPFIKLVMSNNDELFNENHTSAKIFESPIFHAIIKYKWHLFGRIIHFLLLFIYTIFLILFAASNTLDFNKNIKTFNAIKDYSEEIAIAASNSYIKAITATIDNIYNATNSVVNNAAIGEAVKSNIDVITTTIYKAAYESEAKLPHIDILAINNAAIGAVNNKKIMIILSINNVIINNNYIMEINKAINGIDTTAINEAINSIGGKQLMIVCMIFLAIMASTAIVIINGFMELKFLDCRLEILGTFKLISGFFVWGGFGGLLCFFKKIGVFSIVPTEFDDVNKTPKENTFENYGKSFNNVWTGFINDGYDFLDPWKNNNFVTISKIIGSFFTVIIAVNLFIAIINNIYEDVHKRAYIEWTVFRARVIAYFELTFSLPKNNFFFSRKDKDYFPPTIVYEVPTEKFEEWHRSNPLNDV
ncbi:hypothetical protein C1645_827672 [Glomus cerebriforme]|uniref:Ion transport domain-containing protein n=1 Tax=Glomus cerebriforme TaxID=658196 RepID=A0A397SNB8_9GLOM|nr:hypothetical protein C1645_827672 [Glomus cerebriforme]